MRLHHVQLAIPPGSEAECRKFYCDLLGWEEIAKPPVLAARGGLWLNMGDHELHLGVEQEFQPAKKAHPGILVDDVHELAARLEASGVPVRWDAEIPHVHRFYVSDPFGNRLEFLCTREVDS